MRLTLRTMLAYLDDILEPDDTEDIGRKIEESEFATDLVHRTRDCIRRLRLGVPALLGRGLGADPNSVAEYLDNKLDGDRVPEFEKICLESDIHLAEVAACHQILTLVLGEPAEINPESRQRMYQLAALADAPPVQVPPVQAEPIPGSPVQADVVRPQLVTPVAPPVVMSNRRKPEVPDYLREPPSRFWPVAVLVATVAVVTFGALMAFGPAEWRAGWMRLAQRTVNEESGNAPEDAIDQTADQASSRQTDGAGTLENGAAGLLAEPVENAAGDAKPTDESAASDDAAPGGATARLAPITPGKRAMSDDTAEPAPEPADPAIAAAAGKARPASRADADDIPFAETPGDGDDDTAMPEAEMADPAQPAEAMPEEPTELASAADPQAKPAAKSAAPEADEAASTPMGRYTSKHEVLLRYDAADQKWLRLAAMSSLAKGDRLLSLPLFRPAVTLSSGITIQADGASQFEMAGWTADQVPIVKVDFGRLLMLTAGKGNNSIVLDFGTQQALLTFVDPESMLALDVRRVLEPGSDPQAGLAPLVVDLYATSGLLRVQEDNASLEVESGTHRTLFAGTDQPATAREFPKWVSSEAVSDSDRTAMSLLEPLLLPNEPVTLVLKEHAQHRRREVRSLAIRSLAYLGDFDACIAALNEKDEKTFWPIYIDELRLAVARDPDAAARVREAFVKQRAPDAGTLFRMLWGYSADDLKSGAARDLVEGLNHESLDVRALAFASLQNVTGAATHGYSPTDPEKKRRTGVNAWREKLRTGKIVPKPASAPKGRGKSAEKDAP